MASISDRLFRDKVRIEVAGGKGGDGCASFARTLKGKGAPNGGNGGKGGNVYLQTSDLVQSYSFQTFHLRGQTGKSGGSDGQKGRTGEDLVLEIPTGTRVHEIIEGRDERGERHVKHLINMDEPGMRFLAAEGGESGMGNAYYADANKYFSSYGVKGTSRALMLELRLLADVGLVGYPNAGKSSLLCALSHASPKIASYPFTTLKPMVGVIETNAAEGSETWETLPPITMADIPGLVDGAHLDVGLGHDFLRHIERTKVLLYVVDVAGLDGRDPVESFKALQRELELFNPTLLRRKAVIFANKTDRKPKTSALGVARLRELKIPVLEGSALKKRGLEELVAYLRHLIGKDKQIVAESTSS